MIDYYSLYKNSLEAIGYHNLDTGVDLLQYLIATEEGKRIYSQYPYQEVEEIIFYTLDCLIQQGLVTATEMPRLDRRIYTIDGLTPKGTYFLGYIGQVEIEVIEWLNEFEVLQNPESIYNALRYIIY
ncbi:TPA: hypothetical protein VBA95_000647 [Streptococcus agalactiae]|uniref:hypothetical protein n=1 Tax=Streptococcus agalactiae TaxID=1311 RepID=UPI000B638E21|nr:hypothetical protein [Streptococcus agalactiae]OTG59121.1 hypothetical protein B7930_03005 [Streptococcus agalactiae]RRA75508.1 hypothetical protein D5F81_08165 [Streptococcus agalactiae]RRA76196.1 hypothetical protein D5F92_04075 [Streptococcus agalactiae]HEO6662937.1 hypothetical protein [Streptococcus agalactiae]HEO6667012.1 hypothetical protein [Streptococcus agalactiae]